MVERISYLGLPNCYRITNHNVELIVTTDMGPRIVRYGFAGADNLLGEHPEDSVGTEWGKWRPLAGHRLWTAPEQKPRSYAPDNSPVTFNIENDLAIRLTQETDQSGVEKQIAVTLEPSGSDVTITHKITNRMPWPITFSPWALTIMNSGGTVIIPLEPFRSHDDYLLPAQRLVRWYFTDFTDPRWTIGKKYIRLSTDDKRNHAQKVGIENRQGWSAYLRDHTLFIKRFDHMEGADYPDFGCNNETFSKASFIELESLGPLTLVQPGEHVQHIERWSLFPDIALTPHSTDDEMESVFRLFPSLIL